MGPLVDDGTVGGRVGCGGADKLPALFSTDPAKLVRRESWKLAIIGGDVSLNESRCSCEGT